MLRSGCGLFPATRSMGRELHLPGPDATLTISLVQCYFPIIGLGV